MLRVRSGSHVMRSSEAQERIQLKQAVRCQMMDSMAPGGWRTTVEGLLQVGDGDAGL